MLAIMNIQKIKHKKLDRLKNYLKTAYISYYLNV
jgi:hypothetical protein